MFLSIFAASCRSNNLIAFLNNLAVTCDDSSSFEVLIKLDDDDVSIINALEDYKKTSNLDIKYLATPRLDGYYTLNVGYNELLKIAHPDTYFCWLLTDEIRFESKGWDSILKKYIKLFQDDIFRIKLSVFALKNYYDFFECLPCPDNYAVTTRKWLEITGGWGDFWGPDSWHQCIDYFLGQCRNTDNPYGTWRSVPVFDIKIGGQEAGQGIEDTEKLNERVVRIWQGWTKYSRHQAQENFNRLALRLNVHIEASAKQLEQYIIEENYVSKEIRLYNFNKTVCLQSWSFLLPRFNLRLYNGKRKLSVKQILKTIYINKLKKHVNILTLTLIAFIPTRLIIEVFNKLKLLSFNSIRLVIRIVNKIRLASLKTIKNLTFNQSFAEEQIDYFYDGKYLHRLVGQRVTYETK